MLLRRISLVSEAGTRDGGSDKASLTFYSIDPQMIAMLGCWEADNEFGTLNAMLLLMLANTRSLLRVFSLGVLR